MGRKIGSYIDPESGETHYMDVGNLAKLAIIPEQVVRFKDDRNTLVNFRAVENEKEHAVMIYADYEYRGEKITSEPIFIDEEALANEMLMRIRRQHNRCRPKYDRSQKAGRPIDWRKAFSQRRLVEFSRH